MTLSPLIWPTTAPSVWTWSVSRSVASRSRSRRRPRRASSASSALAQQVLHPAQVGRELGLVVGPAAGGGGDPLAGGAVERQQAVPPRQRRHQPGEARHALGVAVHAVLEVHGHLEQIEEVRVVLGQQVVEHPVADERDLDVERDRRWLQRHRADQPERRAQGLYSQLAAVQRPLELVPGLRPLQQLADVDDQVAAVRPVQRPGSDQRVVRGQRPHPGDVLDPADQRGQRGVVLVDDGRALLASPVHQHVDAVGDPGVFIIYTEWYRKWERARRGGQEAVGVGDDVVADLVEPGDDVGEVGHAVGQVGEQVPHGEAGDLAVEVAELLAELLLPARDLLHGALHLVVDGAHVGLQGRLGLCVELREGVGRDDLAVADRGQRDPGRRADERDVAVLSGRSDGLEGSLLAVFEGGVQRGLAGLVVLGLEGGGDGGGQILDELRHAALEVRPAPRREA